MSTVPDEFGDVFDDLRNALAFANVATRRGVGRDVRVSAARIMHRTLRRLVGNDALWAELTLLAEDASLVSVRVSTANLLVERLWDMFAAHQAVLLQASGYKSPPRPSVFELLERTRRVLPHPVGRESLATVSAETLDQIRTELRNFVQEMGRRAPRAQSRPLRRLLGRARVLTAGLSSFEVGMQGPVPTAKMTFKPSTAESTAAIATDLSMPPHDVQALAFTYAARLLQAHLREDLAGFHPIAAARAQLNEEDAEAAVAERAFVAHSAAEHAAGEQATADRASAGHAAQVRASMGASSPSSEEHATRTMHLG